jgi:hypothetical protein
MDRFVQYYRSDPSKNFILKAHLAHLDRYDTDIVEFLTQSDSVFRIKLQRRDVVRQIASQYIGTHYNKWRYRAQDLIGESIIDYADPVPLDTQMLCDTMLYIIRQNRTFVNCTVKFDLELWYEDLPAMNKTDYHVTPRPANYQEIIDAISVHSKFISQAMQVDKTTG